MVDSPDNTENDAARRAYGVLATGVGEALAEVRAALADHANLLPEGRLADLDTLLDEFRRRRIRVAFYGEIKAGKSTLINALAGRELSPSAFDPLTSLPIRITYGPETVWRLGQRCFADIGEVADLMRLGAPDAAEIVVETPVDLLQLGGQVDLIDTPGVGSDDRSDQISADVLRSLDAVVLVVRYPGLFTKLTRGIMAGLESDIGKLFVVWNLDTDCADLPAQERARHAETLRADVAGAHELHLVDARAALRARGTEDRHGLRDSGIESFVSALGLFASSEKREIAALREAAKRADRWFADAEVALKARLDHLRIKIEEVDARLSDAKSAAASEERAARDQFAHFEAALELAEKDRDSETTRCAALLRRSLRSARARWARSGEIAALQDEIAAACRTYAEGAQAAESNHGSALGHAAAEFGAEFAAAVTSRGLLSPEPLAPAERVDRSHEGKALWLRRRLWNRWYLPGLATLEREGIDTDLTARAQSAAGIRRAAVDAMRAVLQQRVDAIARRRDEELGRIMDETNYEAELAELAGLEEHVPVIASQRECMDEINQQAWKLK
jgi:hypothetical protein